MTDQQQWDEFALRLNAVSPNNDRRDSLGSTNSPRVLSNGFRYGVYNLDKTHVLETLVENSRSLILGTRISLPPHNLLNLALVFSGDELSSLIQRVEEIKTAIEATRPSDQPENKGKGSSGDNNVRVYLHNGGIYLWQHQGEPDEVDADDMVFGGAIRASTAYFADVLTESHLTPVEIEYVGYLTRLLGTIPFQRLDPAGSTSGRPALALASLDIAELKSRIARLGARYSDEQVERFHIAQTHLDRKHFVILSGISGTGKTLLAKSYAYAALGLSSLDLRCDDFFLIPVRPEWNEPSHLLGYFDALSGKFRKTPFVQALLHAQRNSHRPVFICLDEMNIAQPEYYFSDVLSAMETGEPLLLHDDEDEIVPQSVDWPSNLYITGTVNVDETTRALSPKVLDRANIIDLSSVDANGFIDDLIERDSGLAAVADTSTRKLLVDLIRELEPYGLHFGYRVIEEILRYLNASREINVLTTSALDAQIEQKVLTKLRGGPELSGVLDALSELFNDMASSKRTVNRLQGDLDRFGSFQYWT